MIRLGCLDLLLKVIKVYWLLAPFALAALAFGGTIVPRVNLVLSLVCQDYIKNHPSVEAGSGTSHLTSLFQAGEECRTSAISSRTATFKLIMSAISGSLTAVIAPRLGAVSDRYGRTPVLAFISCGMILNDMITILAAQYPQAVSYWWILVGSVFDGATGSFITSMAISQSYVSDCTSSERRNVVFGWLHGCLFTGIAVGPILAGYIIKRTGTMITMFYLSTVSYTIFLLLLAFVIPESVSKRNQLAARDKHRQQAINRGPQTLLYKISPHRIFEPLNIIYGPGASPAIRKNLILLTTLDAVVFGIGLGAAGIILLYSNYMFGWDQWQQAQFTSIVNTCRVTCLLVALPAATSYFRARSSRRRAKAAYRDPDSNEAHLPEGTDAVSLNIIRFAIVADALGFLGFALSPAGPMFILSGAVTSIGGVASPSLQAALTQHIRKENVGQLLGALGLLHALARIIGPMIFTGIYAQTVSWFPDMYFWVLAAMYLMAFAFSWRILPGSKFEAGVVF